MNRRKLIRKLAVPAAIIAVISLILLLLQHPYRSAQFEEHQAEFKKYISKFTEENKNYIKEISVKINFVPVDEVIINELQSEYFIDHQQSDSPKRYLWMSTLNGEYLFGVPEGNFVKMNNAFDKYSEIIKTDDHYRDRNDFLAKLIDKYDYIDFSQFDRTERTERKDRYNYERDWRFYKLSTGWAYLQPLSTVFSTPIYDMNGKLIGELFMKVDDYANNEKYYSTYRLEDDDLYSILVVVFGLLLGFSGAFLWFLLPTWVYTDAQERDVKNPGIWAFLTLISHFFGLTIYLITRPNTLKSFHCPQCEGELNGTKAYCPHCGYDLANTFCQHCQYPVKTDWQFCPNCRAEMKNQSTGNIPNVDNMSNLKED